MAKIPFPPKKHPKHFHANVNCCLLHGAPLIIDFLTEGYFSHNDNTAFSPELPTGFFAASNTIGPYYAANSDHTVTLSFYSEEKMYYYKIAIKRDCPPEQMCPEENPAATG